nr:DNA ligase and ATP dependent DNA ligase and Zinc finger domain containing protein [Haemonchus contortus]
MSTSSTRFAIDYAKRVAGCKKCKLQLPKGEIRLAKITPNPFVQREEGPPPDMKLYYHPHCLFEMFFKARANTKVIEGTEDIEGWDAVQEEDKEPILKFINELNELRANKEGGGAAKRTPKKKAEETGSSAKAPSSSKKASDKDSKEKEKTPKKSKEKDKSDGNKKGQKNDSNGAAKSGGEPDEESKYNSFNKFTKLCDVIASVSKYTDKSSAVKMFITRDDYDGDMLTLVRLLLPGVDQRVYNIKEKQIIKHFATIFDLPVDELLDSYKNGGDVSKTIRDAIEKNKLNRVSKGDWSIQKVDRWLNKLTELTKDDEQITHLKFAAKRLSPIEVQYLLRLVMKDLRINAGVKHILDGLHPSAYEAFQSCRDLAEIIDRVKKGQLGDVAAAMEVGIRLGTPVLPMLAEPCKSVEQAMKKCVNGMFAEIKYDGERIQIHKSGTSYSYFSRSLKPVQHHKISQLEDVIPKAFPAGLDLIIDAEVLLVDNATGKPLPFGTLGVHKKEQFKDASVCVFIFDILRYNDEDLTSRALVYRKKLLEAQMSEVQNRVMMSNYQLIRHGDHDTLKTMIWKAIDEGLEGLVLKDIESIYEPGKRHWLKVKKDYLEEGRMADTADLIVLGAYFGTGSKGGMMSVFLMGVYDEDTKSYRTVTKCGNGHTDDALEAINKKLKDQMTRIDRDFDLLPKWLHCSRSLVPDFVIKDPQAAPVWEITGAEFSKSENHSAGGISIRFPRVTRIRKDKDWKSATSLAELKNLYDCSKTKTDLDRSVEDETPLYAKEGMDHGDIEKLAKGKLGDSANEKNEAVGASAESSGSNKRKHSEEEESDEVEAKKTKTEDDNEQCPHGKTPCKYGAECYRKNKDHKAEFWHPPKK